jgi:hypothetical protein
VVVEYGSCNWRSIIEEESRTGIEVGSIYYCNGSQVLKIYLHYCKREGRDGLHRDRSDTSLRFVFINVEERAH